MGKIEEFKEFAKKNPVLLKYVKNEEMSWQKFFEMYDMYGEDENVWKDYISASTASAAAAATAGTGILAWLKGLDLDSISEGVSSIQRVVGVLGDLGNKNNTPKKEEYKPRPLYKHFDD